MQSLSEALKKPITGELRNAVKPEYDGTSDEHVLSGAVTAQEAQDVFQKWLDEEGLGRQCHGVSAAEVYIGRKPNPVWLPNLLNRDQIIKEWRGKSGQLIRENGQLKSEIRDLKSEIDWLRAKLREADARTDEAVAAAARPLERKIKRLKRAKGRRNNRVKLGN